MYFTKMVAKDTTNDSYTNNSDKKYPIHGKQVYYSWHRYAPTHTENGQLKILHACKHDPRGFDRSHCKSMYVSYV